MASPAAPFITPEILDLVAEIDEFKGAWRALGAIEPLRLAALKRIALIESVGAALRLGGLSVTDREVERLVVETPAAWAERRLEPEAAGYARALERVADGWAHLELTEGVVRRLHLEILMADRGPRPNGEAPPAVRTATALSEVAGDIAGLFTPSEARTPAPSMDALLERLRTARVRRTLHPLLTLGMFAAAFEALRPFPDADGRLGHILTRLLLLKSGYGFTPYLSLERAFEDAQAQGDGALQRTGATPSGEAADWRPWLLFFLGSLRQETRRLALKLEREKTVVAALPILALQILDHVRDHGRVRMAEAVRLTGASRNTLKEHFRTLVAHRRLTLHGAGRGAWYTLT